MRIGRTYTYTRSSDQARGNRLMIFVILAVVCGCGDLYLAYRGMNLFRKYRDVSASLDALIIHPYGYGNGYNPMNNGNVVHVSIPQNEIIFERPAHDPYFNVYVPNAITLERNVEYCQWQEHVHESTHKNNDGSETVERTYYYTKNWRSYLVNSLFFNQPAAHHNPQRNPVSSGFVDRVGISSLSGFKVSGDFMKRLKEKTSIFTFRQDSLAGFVSSPAVVNDKFFYTGSNGWFLSKYDPSFAEQALKYTAQYLEGSLLDFQLGDLFSVCDAGDIRVQIQGQVLTNGVSVIGQQNSDGSITPFKSLKGKDLILIQSGQVGPEQMKEREIGDRFSKFIWNIVGFVIVGALCALFVYLSKEAYNESQNNNVKTE